MLSKAQTSRDQRDWDTNFHNINVAVQGYCKLPLPSNTAEFSAESLTQGIRLRKIPPTSECPHRVVRRWNESQGSLKLWDPWRPYLGNKRRKGIKTADTWGWGGVGVFYLCHKDKDIWVVEYNFKKEKLQRWILRINSWLCNLSLWWAGWVTGGAWSAELLCAHCAAVYNQN